VNYSEERFNEVVKEAKVFLKTVGYRPEKIPFVPISGWTGENLKTRLTGFLGIKAHPS